MQKYCLYIKTMRLFSCSRMFLLMTKQHRACSNGLDLFKNGSFRIIGLLLFLYFKRITKLNRSTRQINSSKLKPYASTIFLIKDFSKEKRFIDLKIAFHLSFSQMLNDVCFCAASQSFTSVR